MVPPKKEGNSPVVVTNPDPTVAVKDALELAIKNLDEKITGRFKANDDATILARNELKDQLVAILATINDKFIANEKLVDQLGKANSTALTAALMTQEKSAAKSEQLIGDLIKQLKLSFDETNKATNEKIDRLTSRLDTGEGRSDAVAPSMTAAISAMMGDIRMLRESREAVGGHAAGVKDNTATYIAIAAVVISIIVPFLARLVGAR